MKLSRELFKFWELHKIMNP